jgi:hypothetical protein
MSKHSAKRSNPVKRFGRLPLIGLVVAAILAITAITVISRQNSATRKSKSETVEKVRANSTRTYVTRRVSGQEIQIDTQSGEIKPLTVQEAEKLAAGLAPMLDQSREGLVQVRHADGSVSMDLEGRFQNVTVARINKDGTVSQSCVDNPQAAGKFFGIDHKLIENAPTARKRMNRN